MSRCTQTMLFFSWVDLLNKAFGTEKTVFSANDDLSAGSFVFLLSRLFNAQNLFDLFFFTSELCALSY